MDGIRRAGDVVGTPDWQLDRLYETDTERLLEKVYAEDEDYSSIIKVLDDVDRKLDDVVDDLLYAAEELEKAYQCLNSSEKSMELLRKVEGIGCDVRSLAKELGRRETA